MLEDDKNTMNENMEENINETIPIEEDKCYYHEQVKRAEKKKQYRPWMKYIATCLIISIAGGGSFGVGLGWSQNYFSKALPSDTTAAPISSAPPAKAVSSTTMSKKDVIKTVMPSVVSISTKIQGESIWGMVEGSGAGSGIIFYEDDEKVGIVTNNHVIRDAAEVYAIFDEEKEVKAKIVGRDTDAEIAVLTVSKEDLKKEGIEQVTVAIFGDSYAVDVGYDVFDIGISL